MPTRSHQPTLVDVAAAAGVSRATASRALSDYGRIAPATVERVREAARRLGYRPNTVAQSMRAGRTQTIGLVMIADMTNAFFSRATKAIVTEAKAQGLQVLIANTDEDPAVERQAVETLLQQQVDGLIVVPSTSTDHAHLKRSHLRGTPVILVDRRLDGTKITSITTDDASGARASVVDAYARGHRRMGFVVAVGNLAGFTTERIDGGVSTVRERTEGFAAGAQECGVLAEDQLWLFTGGDPSDIDDAVEAMLGSATPPTIIFSSNNDVALGVLRAASRRKLVVGKDISLVTVDDTPWAATMTPGITVVARPVEELGAIAVERLCAEMENPNLAGETIVLPTTLITRGSVADLTGFRPTPRRKGR